MNFADLAFWLLLLALSLAGVTLRRLARLLWPGLGPGLDLALLAAMGIGLFGFCDAASCLLLVAEIVLSWGLVRLGVRASPGWRKVWRAVNVVVLVGVLAGFKYAHVVVRDLLGMPGLAVPGLPAGISFYTFQLLAFVLDSFSRGQPALDGVRLLASSTFFPLVVSGPIERADHLGPQLSTFRFAFTGANLAAAVPFLALGLFMKFVLADNLAMVIDGRMADNPYSIWFFCLLSGLQLYFDFAGYSFIAVGLARCFGLQLVYNFLAPFTARSIREFWRRWHISLMVWFRDYVYFPLGGSRTPWWFLNVLAVWLISGMWHGAGWSYVLWGLLHGCYIGIAHLLGPRLRLGPLVSTAITFVAITFSWLFFFETNVVALGRKVVTLANPLAYSPSQAMAALRHIAGGDVLPLMACLGLAGVMLGCEFLRRDEEMPYSLLLRPWVSILFLASLPLLAAERPSTFVYFAF